MKPSTRDAERDIAMKTFVTALILASTAAFALPQPAPSAPIPPPQVPTEIQVPAGFKPYLKAHAIGTQGYVCVPVGTAFAWKPFGPQATLFDEDNQQAFTHFLSVTP